jgi:hypothetical protein
MNDLFDTVLASSLFENENVRRNVLMEYFPKTLLREIGYETLCKRVFGKYSINTFLLTFSFSKSEEARTVSKRSFIASDNSTVISVFLFPEA